MNERREELELQLGFWERSRQDPTYRSPIELMLLDETGESYSSEEVRAIMELVPAFPEGSRMLELAAGVGRLTPHLAGKASHIVASDFVPEFVAQNRASCTALGLSHVEHLVADAAVMELPPASFDMVFSNWLLMYLTDSAARALVARALTALRPSGYLFIHESCDPDAVADPRLDYEADSSNNPARYRHPRWYEALFEAEPKVARCSRHDLTALYHMDESLAGTQIAWRIQVV
jgi:phosphoethanolamine N-methyltransferase